MMKGCVDVMFTRKGYYSGVVVLSRLAPQGQLAAAALREA